MKLQQHSARPIFCTFLFVLFFKGKADNAAQSRVRRVSEGAEGRSATQEPAVTLRRLFLSVGETVMLSLGRTRNADAVA